MVVDDVQEDLNSGPVQRLDHIPELVERPQRIAAGTVAVMGGEKRKGGIPPVIAQSRGTILLVKGEDGEQFDRADSEVLQVWGFFRQSGIGAPPGGRDAGTGMSGEAAHMHLV